MDNRIAFVVTFRDEMAIQQDIYEERAEAFEAVGLSDSGTSNA